MTKQLGDLGIVLSYIGLIILLYGTLKYGNDILRGTVGETVFIGAAGCTGLTGATLTACQKAQVKPKPAGITAAKPRGITAARPRGITAARSPIQRAKFTGGGVGGPSFSAYDCMKTGGIRKCYTTGCRCLKPITASSPIVLAFNQCVKKAKQYTESAKKIALDRLALQYGYKGIKNLGINPGQQLLDNNAQSGGYQAKQLRNKYDYLQADMIRACEKKYLGLDIQGDQNRGRVPRAPFDPKAGGIANPRTEKKPLGPGEYPV